MSAVLKFGNPVKRFRWRRAAFVLLACALLSAPLAAARPFRVLYSGTSITCGTGAGSYEQAFPSLVNRELPSVVGAGIESRNICYGGELTITQLVTLRQEGLAAGTPDLIIIEAGTLDLLDRRWSAAALETICRLVVERRVPAILLYPWTRFKALPEDEVLKLASTYGIPVVNIAVAAASLKLSLRAITTDRVHPNGRGHALIAAEIIQLIRRYAAAKKSLASDYPPAMPSRIYSPDLKDAEFVPASEFFPDADGPLSRFRGSGKAAVCASQCQMELRVRARLVVVVFSHARAPVAFSFQVDDRKWRGFHKLSTWVGNYILLMADRADEHRLLLQLTPGNVPVSVDGFILLR